VAHLLSATHRIGSCTGARQARLNAAMPPSLDLPDDLTFRPLVFADAAAVAALIAAQERHDVGESLIAEADIVGHWGRPSFDLTSSTVGIFDRAHLVGFGELMTADRADAAVEPGYRGRGIGTQIAGWIEATSRSRGMASVGMPVPEHSAADRLLAARGYEQPWTAWDLAMPIEGGALTVPNPVGVSLRAAELTEHEACWRLIESAFMEWSGREREPFGDWIAETVGRPGFEPWNLRVAADDAGEVLGATVIWRHDAMGYIEKLAVRKDQRGRGYGLALLRDAFRAAAERGATTAALSTDTRSGALGLYEEAGLRVTATWVQRRLDLRPPHGT
jgi:GNAT superfamily N-acetyltransferase